MELGQSAKELEEQLIPLPFHGFPIFKKMSESAPTLTFSLWFYVKWTVTAACALPAYTWEQKGSSAT